MDNYREVLENVAKKELYISIIVVAILCVIIGVVWGCSCFHFKRLKNKHPKKYNLEKQLKIRRQSIFASIILTIICICLGVFFIFDTADTISDINKDIEGNAYITYTGDYYVDSEYTKYALYDRWLTVTFRNNDYAFMYMNSFFERISTDEGQFEGKVVYGENSLIVVETEN